MRAEKEIPPVCKKSMSSITKFSPIAGGVIESIFGQPSSPRVAAPPPAPPPPAAPPEAPVRADAPVTPDPRGQAEQEAEIQARAEVEQRRRRGTMLTGPGGISKERFGDPRDITKAKLFGGGTQGY